MKYIKERESVAVNCDTGKDAEWRLFQKLLVDLGISKPEEGDTVNDFIPDLSELDISKKTQGYSKKS